MQLVWNKNYRTFCLSWKHISFIFEDLHFVETILTISVYTHFDDLWLGLMRAMSGIFRAFPLGLREPTCVHVWPPSPVSRPPWGPFLSPRHQIFPRHYLAFFQKLLIKHRKFIPYTIYPIKILQEAIEYCRLNGKLNKVEERIRGFIKPNLFVSGEKERIRQTLFKLLKHLSMYGRKKAVMVHCALLSES